MSATLGCQRHECQAPLPAALAYSGGTFLFVLKCPLQGFAQVLNIPFDEQVNAHTPVFPTATEAENVTIESPSPSSCSHYRSMGPALELDKSGYGCF